MSILCLSGHIFLTWSSKFPAVKAGWHQSRVTAGGTQQKRAFHGLLRAVTSIPFRLRADLPESVPKASFLSVKWMVLSNSCYPGWESEQDLAHSPATKFLPRGCVQVVCIWITLLHTFQEKQVCRLLCGVPAKFHPEISEICQISAFEQEDSRRILQQPYLVSGTTLQKEEQPPGSSYAVHF